MTRIISKESVRRANACLGKNTSNINMDSKNFVSKINTSFGSKEFVVSRQKLNDTAKLAMKRMRNG
ncbi:MAG TPA: hypothetical protein DEQ30_15515 [Porphyromonadaceae bacterium]|nr:hypothetical protein [Porphyromonadaceae bacterium]